jgi:hypothetical protein
MAVIKRRSDIFDAQLADAIAKEKELLAQLGSPGGMELDGQAAGSDAQADELNKNLVAVRAHIQKYAALRESAPVLYSLLLQPVLGWFGDFTSPN